MSRKVLISIIVFLGIFVLLFIFRLMYGFADYPSPASGGLVGGNSTQELQHSRSIKNIATKKYKDKASTKTFDQKYEKIANMSSRSKDFKSDEEKIRSSVTELKALIQDEQKSGLAGRRSLSLMIGVPPEHFDTMVAKLSNIGELVSINIEKRDKTNEYRELNAKQNTLIKTRDSLVALKQRNANVEELMNLETRILEIENEIQSYGVSLGEFDEENEFCTVNILLSEAKQAQSISLLQRIKVALEWTIKWYLLLAFLFACFMFGMLVLVGIVEKFQLWDKFTSFLK